MSLLNETLELFPPPPPEINVQWLENLLNGHGGWATARDIQLSTHGKVNDRELRKLAGLSLLIVSGDKGYKFLEHATVEEIDHAASRLESQGRKMIERSIAIRRNGHRILG